MLHDMTCITLHDMTRCSCHAVKRLDDFWTQVPQLSSSSCAPIEALSIHPMAPDLQWWWTTWTPLLGTHDFFSTMRSRERLNKAVSFPLENLDLSPYLTVPCLIFFRCLHGHVGHLASCDGCIMSEVGEVGEVRLQRERRWTQRRSSLRNQPTGIDSFCWDGWQARHLVTSTFVCWLWWIWWRAWAGFSRRWRRDTFAWQAWHLVLETGNCRYVFTPCWLVFVGQDRQSWVPGPLLIPLIQGLACTHTHNSFTLIHNSFTYNLLKLSILHHLLCLSSLVRTASTTASYYWKKLTCAVIPSF